jgi:predicted secreted acid phosphatase
MRRSLACILGFWLAAAALSAQTAVASPPYLERENLADVINRLVRYHDNGEYDFEIREVATAARNYLDARVRTPPTERLAAIFDIDETSISNWEAMIGCGFCSYTAQQKLYPNPHVTAILPVLELFNDARSKGVAAIFLTGRKENQREQTIQDLKDAAYSGWTELLMRPNNNSEPARVYKSKARQDLEKKGYRIVLNIGDQASDLAGCCSEQVFKLPNPFYLVP